MSSKGSIMTLDQYFMVSFIAMSGKKRNWAPGNLGVYVPSGDDLSIPQLKEYAAEQFDDVIAADVTILSWQEITREQYQEMNGYQEQEE